MIVLILQGRSDGYVLLSGLFVGFFVIYFSFFFFFCFKGKWSFNEILPSQLFRWVAARAREP